MLRLFLIFLAFIINTTITYLWTTEGTWVNLLFKSLSLSMILVLCSTIFVLLLKIKQRMKFNQRHSLVKFHSFIDVNQADKMLNRAIFQIYILHF